MALHNNQKLSRDTLITASNGKSVSALTVFAKSLKYFHDHVLRELTDHSGIQIINEDIRWVITVPAIWRQPAKQFMREAAYKAGIASPECSEQLLIALEPEAASIYCRKLRLSQLVPERSERFSENSPNPRNTEGLKQYSPCHDDCLNDKFKQGTRYMVVDCGGGTVDITVHEMTDSQGALQELHKATGGPFGSIGVDQQFELLLEKIFGVEFINQFRLKRPAAYVELMMSFEARKRSASPFTESALNIFLPFAFIDYFRKTKGKEIEHAVRKCGRKDIIWSSQGMLRLQPSVMRELFNPTLDKIKSHIRTILDSPSVKYVRYLFLVGGFAESQILQHEIRREFSSMLKVIIPQGVSLSILRGAVLFGLDPTIVHVRRTKHSYGVGVLKKFDSSIHPIAKLIEKENIQWCADVFDYFVTADQSVALGQTVVRSYTPACLGQMNIVINIYCTESADAQFITDNGVFRCGTLQMNLNSIAEQEKQGSQREIQTKLSFGDTEIKACALDVRSGMCVNVNIDFLSN